MATKSELTVYNQPTGARLGLRDLLAVLFRRRWIVLGVAVPIIAFGFYGTLTTTASFTASSQVVLEPRAVEDPSFQQRPVDMDMLMSTAVQIGQSIPVATKAAEAIIDSLARFRAGREEIAMIESVEDLRDVILGGVDCMQVGESNLLSIRYTHADPEFALLVAGALTEAYIAYNIEKGQNTSAIGYYSDQIAETQAEIDELMSRRVAVYDRSGLTAFKMNNETGIQQMRALESSYYKARSRRTALQDRYEGVVSAIAADPDYMPSLLSAGRDDNLVSARSTYDEAVLDLTRLRQSFQDSSQHVVRQREYVEHTRQLFHNIRANLVSDLKIDLDMAASEEASLKESLDSYQAELLAYPALEKELYSLNVQIEAKRDLLESLQVKRGEVRLKVQGDERISNITQLNVSSMEMGVGGGKKFLYLMVACLFAVALAVIAAVLVDMQDHRIFDRRQAESTLQLPVLGAVSPAGSIAERK